MDTIQSPVLQPKPKKQYALFSFIFIIVFAVGVFVGYEIPVFRHTTYRDGWNAARARLASSPQFGFLETARGEVKTLDGVVDSVNGNTVTISITPLSPLADPMLDARLVSFSDITRVTKITERNQAEFQKEFDEYMKNLLSGKSNKDTTPPISYSVAQAQATDIKVGDKITVTTSEDIKDAKSFVALEVQIQ